MPCSVALLAGSFATLTTGAAFPPPVGVVPAALPSRADTVWQERIDLYDPVSGASLGSEVTDFAADGRRLRVEITDGQGQRTLLFLLTHDAGGRESGAVYFESDPLHPYVETFSYSADGLLKTVQYYDDAGDPTSRTEIVLDTDGREVAKRYYRADGTQYGEEDVLWNADGTSAGWAFRYTEREGGATFSYRYGPVGPDGRWTERERLRNGTPERRERRTVVEAPGRPDPGGLAPAPFAPGVVSTGASETSPSFSRDGRTLVFARYGADWSRKQGWIAVLDDGGWRAEPLPLDSLYNLSIAPDGATVYAATRSDDGRVRTARIVRDGDGWTEPEDLTARYGIAGTYAAETDEGDLLIYVADGPDGAGTYLARRAGSGFAAPEPFYRPDSGDAFDVFGGSSRGPFVVTRCFDDTCAPGDRNGVWRLDRVDDGLRATRVPGLPYVWGVQPVPALGLLVFTDGEDVLSVPLASVPELAGVS